MQKAFTRIPRPALAGLLLALILGVSLAFPSVRALASNFLGIFRVQQVQVVPINPANLPQDLQSVGPSIQSLMSEDFSYKSAGQPQTVTSAGEASNLAGFAVRLPSDTLGNPQITVQPGAQGTLKVDLARIQAILQEMGRTDVNLPASLNNATITVNIPASVTSAYGVCQRQETPASGSAASQAMPPVYTGQSCTALVQLPSPTVSAPSDLDINQLGKEFLLMSGVLPGRRRAPQPDHRLDQHAGHPPAGRPG